MRYQVNHIHLKSPDPDKTARWYIDNFGAVITNVQTASSGAHSIWMDLSGFRINVTGAGTGQVMPRGTSEVHYGLEHFGFDTDDIAADIARLERAGTKILQPIQRLGNGRQIAYIEGPDDVLIEIVQPAG